MLEAKGFWLAAILCFGVLYIDGVSLLWKDEQRVKWKVIIRENISSTINYPYLTRLFIIYGYIPLRIFDQALPLLFYSFPSLFFPFILQSRIQILFIYLLDFKISYDSCIRVPLWSTILRIKLERYFGRYFVKNFKLNYGKKKYIYICIISRKEKTMKRMTVASIARKKLREYRRE